MKVSAGAIDRQLAGKQRAALLLDIASSAVEVYKLTDVHIRDAERLIGKHSFTRRLRTLDALQLAIALDHLDVNVTQCDQDATQLLLAADKLVTENSLAAESVAAIAWRSPMRRSSRREPFVEP